MVGTLVACDALSMSVTPASAVPAAGPTRVQAGSMVILGGSSVTATLSSPSTTGTLLVASIVDLNTDPGATYAGPAGWVRAATITRSGAGPVALFYYPNNPGSISSVTFTTGSTGANTAIVLSEYSGVAANNPVDVTGTVNSTTSSANPTVSTSAPVSSPNELAITVFGISSGLTTLNPGSGWAALTSSPTNGVETDYLISPTSGTVASETLTSNPVTVWAAVIVVFKRACGGGSIQVTASPTVSLGAITLSAYNTTVTATAAVTVDDESGAGAGWNLTATSTTLTNGSATLPATSTQVTSGAATAGTGNCSLPTNTVSYPVTLPAGTTAPTAVRVYNASAGTGAGPSQLALATTITVPANARAGTYSSTITFTVSSGP